MGMRAEWVVGDSDRSYIDQRLLPAVIRFLGLSDKDFMHHLYQKS